MKARFICLICMVLLSGGKLSSAQSAELLPESIDFGRLDKFSTSHARVTLYNRSSKSLVILDTSVDCSCTKLRWSKAPLAPGDSAVIEIKFRPTDAGYFYKNATITTSAQKLKLTLRANVK